MKNFLLGVLFVIILEGIIGGFFVYSYKKGNNKIINKYFGLNINPINEKESDLNKVSLSKIKINYNNKKKNNEKINNEKINNKIKLFYKDKGNYIEYAIYTGNKLVNKNNIIKISKNQLYKELLLTFLNQQSKVVKKEGYHIIFFYELIKNKDDYHNLCRIYDKYNSYNLHNIENILNKNIYSYLLNRKNKDITINNYYKIIKDELKIYNLPFIHNKFCNISKICDIYADKYLYVKKAIIYNKSLKKYINKISKKYNVPKETFYDILIIENLRMHTTYKTMFKSFFLKYKVPKLSIMTKFSYGMFGIKMGIVEDILNSAYYLNNIDNIQNNFYIKKLKDIKTNKDRIEYIIKNKYLQVALVGMFLKSEIYKYKKYGCDIKGKSGDRFSAILATLWNIGGAKISVIKKCNPKLGGANINFYNNDTFGNVANMLNHNIDILYIITK